MKQPIELKALGINRELSSLRLWAFRLYMLVAIPTGLLNGAVYGIWQLFGFILGICIFSVGVLYLLSSEKDDTLGMRETAN